MAGTQVNSVYIRVRPNTEGFAAEVERMLKSEHFPKVEIGVVLKDLAKQRQKAEKELSGMEAEVGVSVSQADIDKIKAEIDHLNGQVDISATLDKTEMANIKRQLEGLKANVNAEMSKADLASIRAQLDEVAKSTKAEIKPELDKSAAAKARAELDAAVPNSKQVKVELTQDQAGFVNAINATLRSLGRQSALHIPLTTDEKAADAEFQRIKRDIQKLLDAGVSTPVRLNDVGYRGQLRELIAAAETQLKLIPDRTVEIKPHLNPVDKTYLDVWNTQLRSAIQRIPANIQPGLDPAKVLSEAAVLRAQLEAIFSQIKANPEIFTGANRAKIIGEVNSIFDQIKSIPGVKKEITLTGNTGAFVDQIKSDLGKADKSMVAMIMADLEPSSLTNIKRKMGSFASEMKSQVLRIDGDTMPLMSKLGELRVAMSSLKAFIGIQFDETTLGSALVKIREWATLAGSALKLWVEVQLGRAYDTLVGFGVWAKGVVKNFAIEFVATIKDTPIYRKLAEITATIKAGTAQTISDFKIGVKMFLEDTAVGRVLMQAKAEISNFKEKIKIGIESTQVVAKTRAVLAEVGAIIKGSGSWLKAHVTIEGRADRLMAEAMKAREEAQMILDGTHPMKITADTDEGKRKLAELTAEVKAKTAKAEKLKIKADADTSEATGKLERLKMLATMTKMSMMGIGQGIGIGAIAEVGVLGFAKLAHMAASFSSLLMQSLNLVGGLALALPGAALAGGAAFGVMYLAIKGMDDAVPGLSKKIKGMKDDLQKPVAENFWKGAADGANILVDQVFPRVKDGMSTLATTMGGIAGDMAGSLNSWDMSAIFGGIDQIMQTLRPALGQIMDMFGTLAAAAMPALNEIAGMFTELIGRWNNWVQQAQASGKLGEIFKTLASDLRAAFAMLGGGFGLVMTVIQLLGSNGTMSFQSLADTFKRLTDALNQPAVFDAVKAFFDNVNLALSNVSAGVAGVAPFIGQILSALGAALPQIGATIGQTIAQLGPAFSAIAGMIPPIVGALNQILPVVAGLISSLLQAFGPSLTMIIQTIGTIFATVGPMISQTLGVIGPLFTSTFQALLPPLMNLFNALMPVILSLLPPIMQVVNVLAQALGPVIQSLVPVIQQLAPVIGQIMNVAAQLVVALMPLVSAILLPIGPLLSAIIPLFQPIINMIIQLLPPIIQLVNGLAPVIMQLLMALVPLISSLIVPLTQIIQGVMTPLMSLLNTLIPIVLQLVQALLPPVLAIIQMLVPLIGALLPVLMPIVQAILMPLIAIIQALLPPLMQIVNALLPALAPIIQAITAVLITLNPLFTALGQIILQLIGPITEIISFIGQLISTLVSALMPAVMTIVNTIVALIRDFVQIIMGVINVFVGLLTGNWSQAWQGVKQIFSGVWDAIVQLITGVVSAIIQIVGGLLTAVINIFHQLADGMKNKISDGINAVVNFFRDMGGKITGAIRGLGGELQQIGADMMAGLKRGIENAVGGIIDAAKGAVKSALDAAKSLLGIHSPSRVWRDEVGVQSVAGMIEGFDKMEGKAVEATRRLVIASTPSPDAWAMAAPDMAAGVTSRYGTAGANGFTVNQYITETNDAAQTAEKSRRAFMRAASNA